MPKSYRSNGMREDIQIHLAHNSVRPPYITLELGLSSPKHAHVFDTGTVFGRGRWLRKSISFCERKVRSSL